MSLQFRDVFLVVGRGGDEAVEQEEPEGGQGRNPGEPAQQARGISPPGNSRHFPGHFSQRGALVSSLNSTERERRSLKN